MPVTASTIRPYPDCPLVVAYGLGVDSTAMLIEFAHRGIRPDLILFADTGLTWARSSPASDERRPSREAWLDQHYFAYWYPLMDWGYDREICKRIIAAAGLPVPVKSACFYCPASKKSEILWLREHHPDLLGRALHIEANAQAKLTSVKGLGRSFAWETYLKTQKASSLFPMCEGP